MMGRYRPPRSAGSPYITPEGEAALRTELHELWKVERPEVTKAVSAAAANGDRSENGDYIYGKKRLREIDSRVRFLRKRLDALQVVEGPLGDRSKAWFGAWVTLEDEAGQEHVWRIVGPDEFDLSQGKISCDSPLGRALLGKEVDAEVRLETPAGQTTWVLAGVTYDETP
jgi:transcription elongation factor GreB